MKGSNDGTNHMINIQRQTGENIIGQNVVTADARTDQRFTKNTFQDFYK